MGAQATENQSSGQYKLMVKRSTFKCRHGGQTRRVNSTASVKRHCDSDRMITGPRTRGCKPRGYKSITSMEAVKALDLPPLAVPIKWK